MNKSTVLQAVKKLWFGIRILFHYLLLIVKKLVRFVLFTLGYFGVTIGIIGLVVAYIKIYPIYLDYDATTTEMIQNCNEETFQLEEPSYIYDNSGDVLIKLKGSQDSTYIEYEDIPENIINAFVAVEDRTFWENPGIDIKGIVRVVVDAIKTKGGELHGASTITQQLARNVFLTHEVSLERKAKEMLLALKLTEKFSKEDIIEFYVNDICFANALYGIESAAKGYFNKSVKELTLSEQVYLCAIPNSPTYYDPYVNPERAITRRDKMLGDMLELGYITQNQYNEATTQEIVINRPQYEFSDYQSTYAIECAVKYLMKLDNFSFQYEFKTNEEYKTYTENYNKAYDTAKNELYTKGYKVYTSLDDKKQQILQDAIDNKLSFSESVSDTGIYEFQGAATLVNNSTGKIEAIIGGRTQNTGTYTLNRAYQSFRQPGSSIKPLIVYAPAIDSGYSENSQLLNIDVDKAKEKDVVVSELKGTAYTLRNAVTKSLNGCAWWLFDKITPHKGISYITEMQFDNIVPDDYFPASSLGGFTYGVTTVEMASAYSALANEGRFKEPTCLVSIIDSDGKEVYFEANSKQVYKENTANTMVNVMQDVVSKGTASSMKWSRSSSIPAAGKTGTTNGGKDGWFCGVTPYYSLAVWVGYDQPRELSNLYGGTYPAEIWKEAMLGVLNITDTSDNKEFYERTITGNVGALDWYSYLPGRSDEELLAENYTVANYRSDHTLADNARVYIQEMLNLAGGNSDYYVKKAELYNNAKRLIEEIYSSKLYKSMTKELEDAYSKPANIPDTTSNTNIDKVQDALDKVLSQ